ncbi:MAG: orotidine-5'-phosphate decarboxylase [Gammaproteobacteria bacterium]
MSETKAPIIVALDFPNYEQALALANELDPEKCRVKIGKELFTRSGPASVEKLQALGFDVFLDLKFHDIPNTVAGACRAAADMGCWMINVHASGGVAMLEAASNAVHGSTHQPLLIAVTILTSLDDQDLHAIGFESGSKLLTQRLAAMANDAGLDGVVSSAHDIEETKRMNGQDFLVVTPGIRPLGSEVGDQARIATPQSALQTGADYLVIGRPITQAKNPSDALDEIVAEIQND